MNDIKKRRLSSLKRKIEATEYIMIFLFAALLTILMLLPYQAIGKDWIKTFSTAAVVSAAMVCILAIARYITKKRIEYLKK